MQNDYELKESAELVDLYADINNKSKELEFEMDMIKQVLLDRAVAEGTDEHLKSDNGKFSVSERRTWTYPEEIMNIDAQLKYEKKQAEQLGTATYEVKNTIRFYGVTE